MHLAVDQRLVAAGYRGLLERRGDLVVTGLSRDPGDCIAAAAAERADVVLVDLREPDRDGLGWVADLKAAVPGVRVLMLRESVTRDQAAHALNAGVDGVLVRTEAVHELFLALDALHRGRVFLTPRLVLPGGDAARAADSRGVDASGNDAAESIACLDGVERRAFVELALGREVGDIARALDVEPSRVEELERDLRERLECPGRADLTRLAIDAGVLPVERGGGDSGGVARTA